MTLVPFLPETAPFSAEQRAWLNGYLAGLFSRAPADPRAAALAQHASRPTASSLSPLTILFGSQTGTAEALAKRAAKEAGKRGFAATSLDMAQVDVSRLAAETNVLVITSTYGDGEPPDNAKSLHSALAGLQSGTAPRLPSLRYTVCGLGDTNYTQFCKCAQDFDTLLEKHGATRVSPRVDCDLDYEAKFASWLDAALSALSPNSTASARPPAPAPASGQPATQLIAADAPYTRANPYHARVLTSRRLSGAGSTKQVHHVEIALDESGLMYEAGDALGVVPHNCPDLVDEVLAALGCDGEEAVPAPNGSTVPLRRALSELYDLGKPSQELLACFGSTGGGVAVATHHVIDLLQARVDMKIEPAVLVRSLRKLQPRLYSISSSPKAHRGEVHLTVGAVRYAACGRDRKGVCSTFLAERIVPDVSRIGVFVHANKSFRPPAGANTPMIMIGPGTGVAPFRAFLHERRAIGARGKNWLMFGDQRESSDFLYREEILGMKADGHLNRLDLAWSRDQQDKVYVQHRMVEHAAELYSWLEDGAHFYVCGDATRMAKDVDAALHNVVARAGGKTSEQTVEYIRALTAAKRYCRDVY